MLFIGWHLDVNMSDETSALFKISHVKALLIFGKSTPYCNKHGLKVVQGTNRSVILLAFWTFIQQCLDFLSCNLRFFFFLSSARPYCRNLNPSIIENMQELARVLHSLSRLSLFRSSKESLFLSLPPHTVSGLVQLPLPSLSLAFCCSLVQPAAGPC